MVSYTNSGLAIPQLKEAVDNDWHLLSPVNRAGETLNHCIEPHAIGGFQANHKIRCGQQCLNWHSAVASQYIKFTKRSFTHVRFYHT
jgi:hypothetical protein